MRNRRRSGDKHGQRVDAERCGQLSYFVSPNQETGVAIDTFHSFTGVATKTLPFGAQMIVGDFNGDGLPDLAYGMSGTEKGVEVFLGTSATPYIQSSQTLTIDYGSGGVTNYVGVADMNGDGKLDLITAGSNGILIAPNLNCGP